MLPPWRVYPNESPYSICWRMGGGEDHIMAWSQWWESERPDEADRIAYFAAAPPPTDWLPWAGSAIWPVPALLHRVDPYRGITDADLDIVEQWLIGVSDPLTS